MTVSKCPHCNETFRVPEQADFAAGLPRDAYGECPWCNELFMMTAVLGKLPPMLTVKSGDGQPIAFAAAAGGPFAASVEQPRQTEDVFDPNATIEEDEGGRETITDDSWMKSGSVGGASNASSDTVADASRPTAVDGDDFEIVETLPAAEGDLTAADANDWVDSDLADSDLVDSDTLEDRWGEAASEEEDEFQLQPLSESFQPMPMRVNGAARPARKKSSPLKTIVGVAVGGALSLPIADGLLTLAGRESMLGIWPTSPSSATVATDVRVNPPAMDPPPPRETIKATGRTLNLPDMSPEPPVSVDELSADQMPVDEMPATSRTIPEVSYPVESVAEVTGLTEVTEFTEATESADVAANDVAAMTLPELPGTPEPSARPATSVESADRGFAMPASPVVAPERATESITESMTEPVTETVAQNINRLREVPTSTPPTNPALAESINQANEVLNEIESMDASDPLRRKAMAIAYREIAEVAEDATADATPARELIDRIKKLPELVTTYEAAAANWLTHASRKTPGILIIGKPVTEGMAKSIELESGRPITVAGDASFPDSPRVIALGRILGDGSDATVEVVVAESL